MTPPKKTRRAAGRELGAFVLFALASAIACAAVPAGTPTRQRLEAAPVTSRAAVVRDVPFFASPREDDCGPSALATVLATAGRGVSLDAVREAVVDPARGGAPTSAMVRYARACGTFALVRERWYLDDLKAWMRAGVPPIVLISASPFAPGKFHYVVLTGYDDDARVLLARDQAAHEVALPYDAFFPRWCESEGWALVVASPSVALPADHAGATAPELGALGWLAERGGDLEAARRHYREALDVDPAFEPARRNLAHVSREAKE